MDEKLLYIGLSILCIIAGLFMWWIFMISPWWIKINKKGLWPWSKKTGLDYNVIFIFPIGFILGLVGIIFGIIYAAASQA